MKKRSFYSYRRYWYHLSSTLKDNEIKMIPWGNDKAFNRGPTEPSDKRICVSPTIAHCLTAIPYWLMDDYMIYRTKVPVKANKPYDVFDSNVTKEGWIQEQMEFVKIGCICFKDVERYLNVKKVIPESASEGCVHYSGKVLKWWKKINFNKYLKEMGHR